MYNSDEVPDEAKTVEVRVRAGGDTFGIELAGMAVLSDDPAESKKRIRDMSVLLLESLPLEEVTERIRQAAASLMVPVVKSDGSVSTVTPEIIRAMHEQRKLKKMEPKTNEPGYKTDQESPPDTPVL